MENFKHKETVDDVTPEALQQYVNSPDLDIPQNRRDLPNPGNVRWLVRNIGIRNKNLSHDCLDALANLAGNDSFSKQMIEVWKQKV
ncbi:hypothetical protein ACFL2U_02690 [Patescibacteria group bacterium]